MDILKDTGFRVIFHDYLIASIFKQLTTEQKNNVVSDMEHILSTIENDEAKRVAIETMDVLKDEES
jgi:hypothetical protein